MNKPLILVVEDDRSVNNLITTILKTHDYRYLTALNGAEAVLEASSHNPDIVLLDLGLPDIDGSEVLRQIRSQSEVPILVVSARGQEREKVEALDLGADDYVTKPFHINELLARVRVALRKKTPRVVKEKVFVLDGLRVDFEKYKVYVEDREVHLTPIEFKLLVLLIEHAGKVLTHSFIIRNIWGYSSCEDSQSLRVFMANIRRKIEKDSSHPRYILTEVGVGYRFVDE